MSRIYALVEDSQTIGTLVQPDDDDFYLEPPISHTLTLRREYDGAFSVATDEGYEVGLVRPFSRDGVTYWKALTADGWALDSIHYIHREDAVCAVADYLANGEDREGEP